MLELLPLALLLLSCCAIAATITVDVNVMPRVVFTGDSQTCGRVGALDYPQMLSWEMPVRVLNTAVGGTNTSHLLHETRGGTAEVTRGERCIRGTKVGWHAGPYPGQTIRLGPHEYVIDRIEVVNHAEGRTNLWITEPAREGFSGEDWAVEPGWRVRIAERHPDWACFMYSVNDTGATSEAFTERLEKIVRLTQALGARPIFLSGVPLMESARGGSHPSGNERVAARARDLADFCAARNIPFGDVFGALTLLDEHSTSVWVDTVHPTTEGSTAIMHALRHIFRETGLADNPYFLRVCRCTEGLVAPGDLAGLLPFTTSQPDYSVANVQDDNHFNLEAIRVRDEYGLISAPDGQFLESDTPLILQFGIGDSATIRSARVRIVAGPQVVVSWHDAQVNRWTLLATGEGEIAAPLPPEALAACRDGALWLALESEEPLRLDYAAVTLEGDLVPFSPREPAEGVVWPPPGELAWNDAASLLRNGNLAQADGDTPMGWQRRGPQAVYIRAGVVAEGRGEFIMDRRVDLFRAPGARFRDTVRPLDMLVTEGGPDDANGNFLISRVEDDETLRVRRMPGEPVADLRFRVLRSSGCPAVPGGCAVQARGEGYWETIIPRVEAGRYRLGFFHRAYAPASMAARGGPGEVARVEVSLGPQGLIATADRLEGSYQWQRAWLEFTVLGEGPLHLRARAQGETAVEYTGFTVEGM